jgi:hypothetical protein
MTDMREELRAFMIQEGIGYRVCARALGVPHVTLHGWLTQPERQASAEFEQAVGAFLARQRGIVDTPGNDDAFVLTTVARKVFEVARICHIDREIGVCYGPAGLGKTIAVKEYARAHTDAILIEADLGHTAKALFAELHKTLGMEGFGTVNQMFQDILEKLRGSGRLIIVDEAEHLPYKALELLRRVYDKAGIGIMLVGMPRLVSNLRGRRGEYAQLYSRVGIAARLEPIKPNDTRMIIESAMPEAIDLGHAFHAAAQGNTRTLSKLIARSQRVAEINNTQISATVIRETARMLMV